MWLHTGMKIKTEPGVPGLTLIYCSAASWGDEPEWDLLNVFVTQGP